MQNAKKTAFSLPYAGIDTYNELNLLYSDRGDFSLIFQIENPVQRYAADPASYIAYQNVLLNIIKILGEGYIVQKQDILLRKAYVAKDSDVYLQQQYHKHFEGREFTAIQTYLVVTRQIKRGAFYVYDKKVLVDFSQQMEKVFDLLGNAGCKPAYMSEQDINRYVSRILGMEFSAGHIVLNNMRAGDQYLGIGSKAIQCITMVNTDAVELPETVCPFTIRQDKKGLKDFPLDNFSFLHHVPGYHAILLNQLIEIPSQQLTLSKLELKRKRHSGVPDPANLMCVEDIDALLVDVARDSQLLVNAHYTIVLCAEETLINKAANFIEAELFQQGITPSKNAYNQLELFRCALPGNGIELKKYDWFLTTADAALCFFFKESMSSDDPSDFLIRFADRQGIPIGIDISDLMMATGRLKNRNRFILGKSGTGKSYAVNAIVEQYLQYNMDVVIVDVGHSYSGLCAFYGGKYITYSEERPITMNPFAISKEEYNIEKKDFLITLICLLWKGADGSISTLERDVIAQVISAYYRCYFSDSGLADGDSDQINKLDFNSFYEFAIKRIPIIKKEARISFDVEEFGFILEKFYKGGEFDTILNEAADESLFNEQFIVYEIDNVLENKILLPVVTVVIMDVFIQKMRHRKNRRKTIILEEAWKVLMSPMMSGFLLYLNKTVRKFWGEIIEVTQEISDIVGNPIVKDSIINNSDTVILLEQNEADFKLVAELLSINEVEQKKIFTINKLDNKERRARFNEIYIRRGSVGEVYGVEVSIFQHLAYTTEKPEKMAVETYAQAYKSYPDGLNAFVADMYASGLSLKEFITQVNNNGLYLTDSSNFFKPDF